MATAGFVASYGAAGALLGTPPALTADGPTVVRWFEVNATTIRWTLWLGIFGMLMFALVASLVRSSLPAPHRDVFFFGAVTFVSATTIQAWIWAGMARHPGALEPGTARVLFDIASYWGPFLCGATVLTLAPVVAATLGRRPVLPRWLGVITAVALVEQVVETVTVFGERGFLAAGGPMNLVLGAGLTTLAWVALAIAVARQGRTAATA